MAKGYCEKKEGKDCSKCFREDAYNRNELPCKYFVRNTRGYEGTLKDIDGIKMRRQWFFTPMIMSIGFIIMLVIAISLTTLLSDMEWSQEDKEFIMLFFSNIIFPIEIALLILSILNIKFFGKTVAVINDDGVYTNQAFIRWDNITEVEFFPRELNYRSFDDIAYVKIVSRKKSYEIAHMPLYFLFKANKYNPEIKLKINKRIIRIYAILFSISFIAPIVLWLLD